MSKFFRFMTRRNAGRDGQQSNTVVDGLLKKKFIQCKVNLLDGSETKIDLPVSLLLN